MSQRPCSARHPEPIYRTGDPWVSYPENPNACRFCWLFMNDSAYRESMGGGPFPDNAQRQVAFSIQAETEKLAVQPSPVPVEEGPGWFRKLANVSKAAVNHAWHGLPETPTEEQERRVSICLLCPHLNQVTGTCNLCGCPTSRKASWLMEKCPDSPKCGLESCPGESRW